jgi:uncharacterized protein
MWREAGMPLAPGKAVRRACYPRGSVTADRGSWSMSAVTIIRFGVNPPKAEVGQPKNIMAGTPTTTTYNYFADASGSFFSGVWESTPGKWAIDYSENEFVYLASGRARVTDEQGHTETFGPGNAFLIPAGFKGIWETIETLRKYYAIYEPHS